MRHEQDACMAAQYIWSEHEVHDMREYPEVVHAIYGKDSITNQESDFVTTLCDIELSMMYCRRMFS
jgi:hypothetical protein